MKNYDVAVIGGGPAGLAAAISAHNEGAAVCLIEREPQLGGILKQCIHDGFGLVRFKEKLSGPEYAARYIKEFEELGIEARLSSFVTAIDKPAEPIKFRPESSESASAVTQAQSELKSEYASESGAGPVFEPASRCLDNSDFAISAEGTDNSDDSHYFTIHLVTCRGIELLRTKSIVLATGCRERTARQVGIHGTRPAGIINAGSAQNYINLLGQLVGRRCVILGSGDIGLIMARRLTLEGAEVAGVYEVQPVPSGLARNVHQCLDDFNIPLHLSTTVTRVYGRERVEAVDVAKVDEKFSPIPGTEEHIECDTLIVSVGLIPENELAESLGVTIDSVTRGPICDTHYQTDVPGVFSCGNCFHVFDLVDYVSQSGEAAGKCAAEYARAGLRVANRLKVAPPVKKAVEPGRLVCIGCPKSCEMTVRLDGSQVTDFGAAHAELMSGLVGESGTEKARFDDDIEKRISVEGNTCPKGLAFAIAELTDPTRVLCTSVKTTAAGKPVLAVRTASEIPKDRLFEAMDVLNHFTLNHSVEVGDVIVKDILGTGVNVIACSNLIY